MKFLKSKKFRIIAIVIVAVIVVSVGVGLFVIDYYALPYSRMTNRFYVSRVFVEEEADMPGILFSMINEDETRIIYITEDTRIRFEGSINLFQRANKFIGNEQTLDEMLDGRTLIVNYNMVFQTLPSETDAIRIIVLDE